MLIGSQLRKLRIKHNLLQKDIAKVLNVRNTTISAWEKNINEPDINTLIKLAAYYNITLDELLIPDPVNKSHYKYLNSQEEKLLKLYNSLSENNKRFVLSNLQGLSIGENGVLPDLNQDL